MHSEVRGFGTMSVYTVRLCAGRSPCLCRPTCWMDRLSQFLRRKAREDSALWRGGPDLECGALLLRLEARIWLKASVKSPIASSLRGARSDIKGRESRAASQPWTVPRPQKARDAYHARGARAHLPGPERPQPATHLRAPGPRQPHLARGADAGGPRGAQ